MIEVYKGACHKFSTYGYLEYHDRDPYQGLAIELF